MSVIGLSGPPPNPPAVVSAQDKSDRKIIIVVIALVLAVVLSPLAQRYSIGSTMLESTANRSVARDLSFDFDQSKNVSTTYSNPPHGVSLTRPGNWSRISIDHTVLSGWRTPPLRRDS